MKRAISMLGAIAALAIGSLVISNPAHAYVIECDPVPLSQAIYPNDTPPGNLPTHAFYCRNTFVGDGVTEQEGEAMAGAVRKMNSSQFGPAVAGYNKLKNIQQLLGQNETWISPGYPVFIFRNRTDRDQYFSERSILHEENPSNPNAFGVTSYYQINQTGVIQPYHSSVLLSTADGRQITDNYNIAFITVHEVGHAVSVEFFPLSQDTAADHYKFGTSPLFKAMVDKDIKNFNKMTSCGLGGLFSGRTKSDKTTYVCSGTNGNGSALTGEFVGKKPFEILSILLGKNVTENEEMFANEVAVATGLATPGPYGFSSYFDNFVCSMNVVKYVVNGGVLPTKSQQKALRSPVDSSKRAGCPTRKGGANGWELPGDEPPAVPGEEEED